MKTQKKSIKKFENQSLTNPNAVVGGHCEFTSSNVIACTDGTFILIDDDGITIINP